MLVGQMTIQTRRIQIPLTKILEKYLKGHKENSNTC